VKIKNLNENLAFIFQVDFFCFLLNFGHFIGISYAIFLNYLAKITNFDKIRFFRSNYA